MNLRCAEVAMTSEREACERCGREALTETIVRNGGTCEPCAKGDRAESGGRSLTPGEEKVVMRACVAVMVLAPAVVAWRCLEAEWGWVWSLFSIVLSAPVAFNVTAFVLGCAFWLRRKLRGSATAVLVVAVVVVLSGWGRAEELPSGEGIAAKYAGDAGIESDRDVIFADGFEGKEIGAGWDEVRTREILSLEETGDAARLGKQCLRVTARLGSDTGGGMTRWFEPSGTVFVRFYARFDERCDYVHHFVTLRANKGLKGGDRWSGFGGAGKRPEGDGRFSTALEPWGNWGKWKAPGRWNFYSYWHEMDAAPDGKYWGNGFRPDVQEDIKKGEWICCEFMLKENTPGEKDGEQAFWIDGKLMGHWKGINWRTSPTLHANALTLEAYITDRWTKQGVNIVEFDNVVVARKYVGPSGS